MTLLLTKPVEGPCERQHEYELAESSEVMGLSVSSTDGALLGLHRVKDGFMSLYDGKDRSLEYTVACAASLWRRTRPKRSSCQSAVSEAW